MSSVRIFTLDGAQKRDPAVEAWFGTKPEALGSIARRWFLLMRACGPDVLELLHDGHPTACIGNVALAYVNAFSDHVNVGFFGGAVLPDPAHILEGTGRFMRHVKIRPGGGLDERALRELISVAYVRMKDELNRQSEAGRTLGQSREVP